MATGTRWTPNDWLRLVGLLGGFGLFALGGWLLYLGISADGSVDIKSTILSGTLKTTSAGLFICFFGMIVIVFSLASLYTPSKTQIATPATTKSKAMRLQSYFWGLLIGAVVCAIGAALTENTARTAFITTGTTLGMALIFLVAAVVRMTLNEDA